MKSFSPKEREDRINELRRDAALWFTFNGHDFSGKYSQIKAHGPDLDDDTKKEIYEIAYKHTIFPKWYDDHWKLFGHGIGFISLSIMVYIHINKSFSLFESLLYTSVNLLSLLVFFKLRSIHNHKLGPIEYLFDLQHPAFK